MKKLKSIAPIFSAILFLLFSSCDLFGTLIGQDPVKEVVRNNPLDPYSLNPIGIDPPLTNGTTVPTIRPYFHFTFPTGNKSYFLQISETESFTGNLAYNISDINDEMYRIANPLANRSTYYWRVRPHYDDGLDGAWTDPCSFTTQIGVPAIVSPTSSDVAVGTPLPLFSWSAVSGIDTYEVCVSSSADFSNGTAIKSGSGFSLKWNEGLAEGNQYWRIRSIDSGVPGDWSDTCGFAIDLSDNGSYYPSDGMHVAELRPKLKWYSYNAGSDGGEITGYQIQIDTSSSFENQTIYEIDAKDSAWYSTASFQIPADLDLNQEYHWRMRNRYGENCYGPWSSTSEFYKNGITRIISRAFEDLPSTLTIGGDDSLFCHSNSVFSFNPEGVFKWTASDNNFYCLSIDSAGELITTRGGNEYASKYSKDGTKLWSFEDNETGSSWVSMPAVGPDGSIFFLFADSTFQSLASDGIANWEWPISGHASPSITSDGSITLYGDGKLFSFYPSGGKQWELTIPGTVSDSSPCSIASDGTIYFSYISDSHGKLLAVSPTGTISWEKDFTENATNEPLIGGDGTVYLGFDTTFYALNSNGIVKWTFDIGLYNSQCEPGIIGNNGTIYLTASDAVIAIDSTDGSEKWRLKIENFSFCQPAVMASDGTLYLGANGKIYVIPTESTGLANSAWPTARHDSARTGCASTPIP